MENFINKRNELIKELIEYNHRGEELLNKMKEITLVDDMVERKDIIDVLPYLTRDEVFSVYEFIQKMLFSEKEENDDIISFGKYKDKNMTIEDIYKIDNKWFMFIINQESDESTKPSILKQIEKMREYHNSFAKVEEIKKEEDISVYEKDDSLPFDISEIEIEDDYYGEHILTFGKYKNKTLEEAYLKDKEYFEWLLQRYAPSSVDKKEEFEIIKKFMEKGVRV